MWKEVVELENKIKAERIEIKIENLLTRYLLYDIIIIEREVNKNGR